MFPGHVTGVHIGGTHLAVPDDEGLPAGLSAEERAFVEDSRRWYADEGAPRSWWRRLQPRLTRYTLLPGAGHFPEWEAPDALAADIAEFARSLRQ